MVISETKVFFTFLKPSNIKRWFNVDYLFGNYFWLYSISSIIYLLINKGWLYSMGFPVILYIMLYNHRRVKRFSYLDILWVIEFLWILFTWIVNDFHHKQYLIIKSFSQDIAFMFSYWIAKNSKVDYIKLIISNAQKPLVIACILGLYFFFFEPAWYLARTEEIASEVFYDRLVDKDHFMELYRLRSFFPSTYSIAYFCAFMLIYEFFNLFAKLNNSSTRYSLSFIMLLMVTSVFCMMRAPFACIIGGFLAAYLYSILYLKSHFSIKYLFAGITIVLIIVYYVVNNSDSEILDFLFSKIEDITDEDSDFIYNRMTLQMQSISVGGEGYCKYSDYAQKLGMIGIPDGEYVKILAEQGYIGLTITITLFVLGILKGLINYKFLYYESCLLIMCMICMIGADPLTIGDKHSFLFWMALGQISRFKRHAVKYKIAQ